MSNDSCFVSGEKKGDFMRLEADPCDVSQLLLDLECKTTCKSSMGLLNVTCRSLLMSDLTLFYCQIEHQVTP